MLICAALTLGNHENSVELIPGQGAQTSEELVHRELALDLFLRDHGAPDVVQKDLQHLGVKANQVQLILLHNESQGQQGRHFDS